MKHEIDFPVRDGRLPVGCHALPLLARDAPAAAARFRRWRGRSGRTYLVSVFSIAACPDFADAVAIAVAPGSDAALQVAAIDSHGALARFVTEAARAGAGEIHIHLLAGDDEAKSAAVSDLAPLH